MAQDRGQTEGNHQGGEVGLYLMAFCEFHP